jgi:bifunctional UDP-N-acetylglucosamine pyrophosphorylase/glucosamine-1-phosphate N-acetyltransferase
MQVSESASVAVMILAAGEGTRMKSATPKVMHSIGGRSLLHHAIHAARGLEPSRMVVVVRHERDRVAAHVLEAAPDALVADQDDVPGTGRAVWCGLGVLDATAMAAAVARGGVERGGASAEALDGIVVVTSGDVPLVTGDLLRQLVDTHRADGNAVTLISARKPQPAGYGRVVRGEDGAVAEIVEHKDATEEQLAIDEVNAGLYAFDVATLRDALAQLSTANAAGELYLTDVIRIARKEGQRVGALIAPDPRAVEGVNDRVQLAAAAADLNRATLERWMRDGVTILDPSTTWVDSTVELGADVTLLPGTQLHGTTIVGIGAVVGPDSTLTDVEVGAGAHVVRTHGSLAVIGPEARVGPFAYLRPGTYLGADGKIGAFVETKNARIGAGSKIPHLSYVGDATIGEHTNIGAATIFVNYDGVTKSHTTVGDHVRIGSDNTLIAPLEIGDGAYTGAGTTVRHDVPPGALAINSSPQQNVPGWVVRRRPGTPSAQAAERAAQAGDKQISSSQDTDATGA